MWEIIGYRKQYANFPGFSEGLAPLYALTQHFISEASSCSFDLILFQSLAPPATHIPISFRLTMNEQTLLERPEQLNSSGGTDSRTGRLIFFYRFIGFFSGGQETPGEHSRWEWDAFPFLNRKVFLVAPVRACLDVIRTVVSREKKTMSIPT